MPSFLSVLLKPIEPVSGCAIEAVQECRLAQYSQIYSESSDLEHQGGIRRYSVILHGKSGV
jgi:hypothetical protein